MTVLPSYTINGVTLPSPNESSGWKFPNELGIDGRGINRLNAFFSYELYWDALTQSEYFTLYRIWQGQYNSGTNAIVTLPKLNATTDYQFITYSGTIVDYPNVGNYSQNYVTKVKMVIRKISV